MTELQDNTKLQDNVVGNVYSTYDYDKFVPLEGNRKVMDKRVAKIRSSINQRGYIFNPIVVNDNMQIVDGQGRFAVLREKGLPVIYVVAEGANLDDCIALNIGQTNWSVMDYIECYKGMGDQTYETLYNAVSLYSGSLGTQVVTTVLGGYTNVGGFITSSVKNGDFEICDPQTAERRMAFVYECLKEFPADKGRKSLWAVVLNFSYMCEEIDNDKLLNNINSYRSRILQIATISQAVAEVEKVYNFRAREKVYFDKLFDEWKEERTRCLK